MEPPRNLGVLFHSTCCLNDHVNKICQNINYQLYFIGKIRKYLDKPMTGKIIISEGTSRLDYCNSLLYGINGYLVSQLQRCQKNAARILSLQWKYDHITPLIKLLNVISRIPMIHLLPIYFCTNSRNVRAAICLEGRLSLLALSCVYSLTLEDGSRSTPMVPAQLSVPLQQVEE